MRNANIYREDIANMEWTTIVTTISGAVGGGLVSIGGLEFFKWWRNRKKNDRIAEAEADGSELRTIKEVHQFLQEQIKELTVERTARLEQISQLTTEKLELVREITMLKTERSLKLCERRGCADRQPQSFY